MALIAVVPKFTKQQIQKVLAEKVEKLRQATLERMKYIGEHFVKNARERASFTDQTGNLRSSIGYVILYNGSQLVENYRTVKKTEGKVRTSKKGKKGQDGVTAAKKVVDEAKKKFPKGFVLIGVAGMDYAAAVESKGYDVITSSSQQAEKDLKAAIERIKQKVARSK